MTKTVSGQGSLGSGPDIIWRFIIFILKISIWTTAIMITLQCQRKFSITAIFYILLTNAQDGHIAQMDLW